jgi:chromosomal replication initiation ATPase DnaA
MISPYVFPILKNTKVPKAPYFKSKMFYSARVSKITKDGVINAIADVYKIDREFYTIKRRNKNLVDARRILCKLLVNELGWTLVAASNLMNNDHTTIIHGIKSFDNLYEVDEGFKDMADLVFDKLQQKI